MPRTLRRASRRAGRRPEYSSSAPEFSIGPSWTRRSPGAISRLRSSAILATALPEATSAAPPVASGITASMVARTAAKPSRPARAANAPARTSAPPPKIIAMRVTSGPSADHGGSGEAWPTTASFRV